MKHNIEMIIGQFLKNQKFEIGVLTLFFCLGFLIYTSSLYNPFMMDDYVQILGNEAIQSLKNITSLFLSSSMSSGGGVNSLGIYYKPLMSSYYALVWNFFGTDPFYYHLPMLIIHILSSWLVYTFSKAFLAKIPALTLGLLFLIHPVNSEIVLYIADAQDIFYFFFGLLSLCVIEFIESKIWLVICLICLYWLGLFSKETSALFLIFGIFYSYFLQPKKCKIVSTVAIIIGLLYLALRFSIGLTQLRSEQLIFNHASLPERVRMLPLILGHYLEIFIFPKRLSITTDFVLHDFSWQFFWIPLLGVLIFSLFIFLQTKKVINSKDKKYVNFFLIVLLFWFLLHGQILHPLDGVYADRWFLIGVWSLLSLLHIFFSKFLTRKSGQYILCLIIIILSTRSYIRSTDWSDPLIFYQREFALHPWDAVMSNNVGVELFQKHRISEAELYFSKSIELNSNWSVSWNNLGAIRENQNNNQAALELYYKSLSLSAYSLAYENYAKLLVKLGEDAKAKTFLQERALPNYPYNQTLQQLWAYLNQKK